jgi:hypothetical protein
LTPPASVAGNRSRSVRAVFQRHQQPAAPTAADLLAHPRSIASPPGVDRLPSPSSVKRRNSICVPVPGNAIW